MRYQVLGAVALLLSTSHALATVDSPSPPESEQPPPIERELALEGHASIAGPYGSLAVALDVTPIPWVALDLGVGVTNDGFQLGAMGRLRLPISRRVAVSVDAGVTTGPYTDRDCAFFDCQSSSRRVWDPAVWRNIGVSVEHRTEAGFHLRGYLGNTTLLNPRDHVCGDDSGEPCVKLPIDEPHGLLYLGVAVGYAFDL